MNREADCRWNFTLEVKKKSLLNFENFEAVLFFYIYLPSPIPKISKERENYYIMQMANPGSCQSHSRVTLHVRNEYLILEVCHSKFKL